MRPLSMREAPPTGGYGGSFLRLWVCPSFWLTLYIHIYGGPKSKPVYFCKKNCLGLYSQLTLIIFGIHTLQEINNNIQWRNLCGFYRTMQHYAKHCHARGCKKKLKYLLKITLRLEMYTCQMLYRPIVVMCNRNFNSRLLMTSKLKLSIK